MNRHETRLAEILAEHSVFHSPKKPFVLASGKTSAFYFDCRRTTMLPEAMPLIGRLVHDRLRANVTAAGGLTMGADPIACAVAYWSASSASRRRIHAFSVRKEVKSHGMQRLVEGSVTPKARVAILEDVVTSGGSSLAAIERCRAEGFRVEQVVVIVDRQEGGVERIEEVVGKGRVSAIFTRAQIDEVWAARRRR